MCDVSLRLVGDFWGHCQSDCCQVLVAHRYRAVCSIAGHSKPIGDMRWIILLSVVQTQATTSGNRMSFSLLTKALPLTIEKTACHGCHFFVQWRHSNLARDSDIVLQYVVTWMKIHSRNLCISRDSLLTILRALSQGCLSEAKHARKPYAHSCKFFFQAYDRQAMNAQYKLVRW